MIINTLLLIIVIAAVIYSHLNTTRRLARLQQHMLEELQQTKKEFKLIVAGLSGVGKHLAEVEKQFVDLADKQNEMVELAQSEQDQNVYAQAAKMIEMGATVEDVMSSCGLSRAESELLKQVRGNMTRTYDELETVSANNIKQSS